MGCRVRGLDRAVREDFTVNGPRRKAIGRDIPEDDLGMRSHWRAD